MKNATSPSHLHSLRGSHLAGFMAVTLAVLIGTGIASAQTASTAGHSTAAMQAVASARPRAAAKSAPHGEEEKSEAKPDDAGHQGIKVHGHWKINIKNPDGTLANTHEFENSLVDGGALLTYLLVGTVTPGEFAVRLEATSAICGSSSDCLLLETSTGYWAILYNCQSVPASCSSNLNVLAGTSGPSSSPTGAGVQLTASIVASSSATLDNVDTAVALCFSSNNARATVTPSQCHGSSTLQGGTYPSGQVPGLFTQTGVNISVFSGQTIEVYVFLSFS